MIVAYLIVVAILVTANPWPERKPWALIAGLTCLALTVEVMT